MFTEFFHQEFPTTVFSKNIQFLLFNNRPLSSYADYLNLETFVRNYYENKFSYFSFRVLFDNELVLLQKNTKKELK